MVGENPKKKHDFLWFMIDHALPMARIRAYSILPPRMQFLWLPLGVSSLCSRFQVCNLNKE